MSILRIVTGPADVGVAGYDFDTTPGQTIFDSNRVEGCFRFNGGDQVLTIDHDAPVGDTVWFHFRAALFPNDTRANQTGDLLRIFDAGGLELGSFRTQGASPIVRVEGDTTESSPIQSVADLVAYSFDIQVVVAATITIRGYINGALFGEVTANNTAAKGVARRGQMTGEGVFSGSNYVAFSEYVVADEDTRGMRLRELRPTAFGIFQEWDGSSNTLRDDDLATGISTNTANRRASFGVTNLENILPSDVINRVVFQSFAQRGEAGLTQFNHFFRFRLGAVEDGAPQALNVLAGRYLEEFTTNPLTTVAWVPADFQSLQIGVQSLA